MYGDSMPCGQWALQELLSPPSQTNHKFFLITRKNWTVKFKFPGKRKSVIFNWL
uniref:Uncharacterized protein n=1 Tax=Arundo donax TaxID=35708 RepID=A0A0A9BW76_ARUDO